MHQTPNAKSQHFPRHLGMAALSSALVLCALACSDEAKPSTPNRAEQHSVTACANQSECPSGFVCLHAQCTDASTVRPSGDPPSTPPVLSITPTRLNFGDVPTGETRTLPVVLSNDGESVITLSDVTITESAPTPPTAGTFRVEQLGAGPFWIRPGSTRRIYLSYVSDGTSGHIATATVLSQATAVTVSLEAD